MKDRSGSGLRKARRWALVAAPSVVGHLAILAALIFIHPKPDEVAPEPMVVELVAPLLRPQSPVEAPAPPSPAMQARDPDKPAPAEPPPPPRHIFRETPLPPDVIPLAAGDGPSADGDSEVTDGQLAQATTAGGAPGGAGCDMVGHLQARLRKDRLVQTALADANRGKAIRVWNGAWLRHPGQDGEGLAAVREAIQWEVAFAPEACRERPVQGLVLIALDDGPGAARVVLGGGQWRWKDLLFARGAHASQR